MLRHLSLRQCLRQEYTHKTNEDILKFKSKNQRKIFGIWYNILINGFIHIFLLDLKKKRTKSDLRNKQ